VRLIDLPLAAGLMALKRTRDLEETGHEIALSTNWMAFKCVGKLHLSRDSEENLKEKSIPIKSILWQTFLKNFLLKL